MNPPLPNSPEFARLSAAEQYHILEGRARQAKTLLPWPDDEDEEKPRNIWGGPIAEAEALKRWCSGKKTPAPPFVCTIERGNQ